MAAILRSTVILRCVRTTYTSNLCLSSLKQPISKNSFILGKRGFSRSTQVKAKKSSITATHNATTPKAVSRKLPVANDSSYKSFAETLSRRSSPTLLYEASSSAGHIIRVYCVGLFCIVYGCYQYYTIYLFPTVDVPYTLSIFSAGAAFFVGLFGLWIMFGSYRVVRSITALPPKSGPLLLRIDSASMFLMLKPRSVTVPHNNVSLSSPLYKPEVKITPLGLALRARQEVQQREKEKARILTLPFRQASYWTWRGFQSMKHVFFGDKFIHLTVKGKDGYWKVNNEAAWVLDDGRALDRLTEKKLT